MYRARSTCHPGFRPHRPVVARPGVVTPRLSIMVVSADANPEWDSLVSRHDSFIAVVYFSGLDSDLISTIGSVRVHGDDETYIVDDCLCACFVRASALVNAPTGGQIQ